MIFLSIGGYEVKGPGNFDAIQGANGDMGENDAADFDSIFYFHHCFIDKMFWAWQQKHNSTKKLDIIHRQSRPNTRSSRRYMAGNGEPSGSIQEA
jgi:tyrosinase